MPIHFRPIARLIAKLCTTGILILLLACGAGESSTSPVGPSPEESGSGSMRADIDGRRWTATNVFFQREADGALSLGGVATPVGDQVSGRVVGILLNARAGDGSRLSGFSISDHSDDAPAVMWTLGVESVAPFKLSGEVIAESVSPTRARGSFNGTLYKTDALTGALDSVVVTDGRFDVPLN